MVNQDELLNILSEVKDPEVPVLTILDLGILRSLTSENNQWTIVITPTYSGCPAMQTIEADIKSTLIKHGVENFTVQTSLSPAWTTDWISEDGKRKLEEYGIAPPVDEIDKSVLFSNPPVVRCPLCKSPNTRMVSMFGSTACKAHYQCLNCLEPFDYFKCLR
ncbi:MAG: phenylacetate-CoA oxygenase subunit PaaJ [Bacteroidetes bacterium]|nr:phenylacetate-CoA oxygenase subunit PaaJ [Bacteroidota bacterium]